jgi:hypothetical protein
MDGYSGRVERRLVWDEDGVAHGWAFFSLPTASKAWKGK